MRYLIYALIVALIILHQDFWLWNDVDPMLFGFIPIGLAYHAGVSVAAAILWLLAIKYCWPAGVDDDDPTVTPTATPTATPTPTATTTTDGGDAA